MINNHITKDEIFKKLAYFIENNDDPKIRANSIEVLGRISEDKCRIPLKRSQYFEIFENCLISDESAEVKNAAAKVIIQNFPKEGIKPLKWVAKNENSIQVLKTLSDFLKTNQYTSFIKDILLKRLSSIFNVIPEEAQLILEIEALEPPNCDYYYFKLEDNYFKKYGTESESDVIKPKKPYSNDKFYVVKNQRIKAISMSGLRLEIVPYCVKALSEIRHLDLSNNNLRNIPDWLGSFPMLEILDLSSNCLTKIPETLLDSGSIKSINLSRNFNLKDILELLISHISSKYQSKGVKTEETLAISYLELIIGVEFKKVEED